MSTRRLKVVLDQDSTYDIRVGKRLLVNLGVHLREVTGAAKAVVITDSQVGPRYLKTVEAGLSSAGFEVFDLTVPAGEESKSITVATELWDALAMLGVGRDSVVIGLGGGVVGDLSGFVASTYMRGISCVQLPTSLLAMVDSSIGGKTAVNLAGGKNLVGTFKQPVYVAADLETLATLPANEWENGFAEIAKSALIDGGEFYQWLANSAAELVAQDEAAVQQAIVQALTFKARVVASDVTEQGVRECLNYGHTFAHAIEAVSGYRISHGRAVAEGMRFAARLAVEAIGVPEDFVNAQDTLLDTLGLQPVVEPYTADELYERMFSDKKVRNGELRFVFVSAPGEWKTVAVDPDLVKIYLILWEQARL
ncbi:MAG: 3-dehydroquinate synthase [Coriobacteriales bacterium]|jgi:3-dehydroquinate synthase|nr:3-dehydroquinate synthase [Coriobacteriales bacterium]